MRNCGSSEQRVWMGPGRYSCRGGRRYADADPNSDAYCYSNPNCYAYCQCHCNGYAPTDANTEVGTITEAASHASAQALDLSIS